MALIFVIQFFPICVIRVIRSSSSFGVRGWRVVADLALGIRMVFVHSDVSWRAPLYSRSARCAVAVAFAHFILRLRLHCDYAHLFSGRTRESLGIVPRVFSRRARRSHAEHLYAFVARPRNYVGGFRFNLPDRLTSSPDVCAAFSGHECGMAGGFSTSGGDRVWDFSCAE